MNISHGSVESLVLHTMSHHIYQTKAFIIDSIDVGEANKILTVFTEDFGVLFVHAQGVRVLKSKLRPSIQDLSYIQIAMVRGKEYWRLTSAEKLISLYDKRIPLEIRLMFSRILVFVKRLATGESKNEELFTSVSKLCSFCIEHGKQFYEDTESFKIKIDRVEHIAKFRILELLGYGNNESVFNPVRLYSEWNTELLDLDDQIYLQIEAHINNALEHSHL